MSFKWKVRSESTQENELITLTFGDMAENHVGMQQIGQLVEPGQGFDLVDLQRAQATMESMGAVCELIHLSHGSMPDAYVLVIRKGVDVLTGDTQLAVFEEQKTLDYDKQAFMYGRVVTKHARWNLCFDTNDQDPDYEQGKGRIIGYDKVPRLKRLMDKIEDSFGTKAKNLKVESNYYYDTKKCGIGFHGDSERRKVVGVRIGHTSMPLYFQWYLYGQAKENPIEVQLNPGDIYIMSEKAVGTDWKKKKIYTLRHATGSKKFTGVQPTEEKVVTKKRKIEEWTPYITDI